MNTKGDIGNFTADANGNGTITLTTEEWNIGSGDPTKDILGKGLIVHEGTDDFVSNLLVMLEQESCSAIIK
jgi:Cu-Zn family superoxide dismutase